MFLILNESVIYKSLLRAALVLLVTFDSDMIIIW